MVKSRCPIVVATAALIASKVACGCWASAWACATAESDSSMEVCNMNGRFLQESSVAAMSSSERPRVWMPMNVTAAAPSSSTAVVMPNTPAKPTEG